MQVASYRGPGCAGGVSPALARLIATNPAHQIRWWHLEGHDIKCATRQPAEESPKKSLSQQIVEGHYRYCNEFLWPIMHGLPKYARYQPEDRIAYERFSRIFSRQILAHGGAEKLFAQDYQLALLAQELKRHEGPGCGVFWHIPWPESVPEKFLSPLIDLAKALLFAEFIGFHTQEYVDNFVRFVSMHVPRTLCLNDEIVVASRRSLRCKVVSAPLGLDVDYWRNLSARRNTRLHPSLIDARLLNSKFVLSVDRADYTKGVVERLRGIDLFFQYHPEMKGEVTFAQLCTRTRPGITGFDSYWSRCQKMIGDINNRHRVNGWQPLVSLPGPIGANELSVLYKKAAVMLVTPLKDGLNLTAKEFVACQQEKPGVLALSRHAGVWHELGNWSLDVEPSDPASISYALNAALSMPHEQKVALSNGMLNSLQKNTISNWCNVFSNMLEVAADDKEEIVNV